MPDLWHPIPAGLPPTLHRVFQCASNVGMLTGSFVSHPERGEYDAVTLRTWYDHWGPFLDVLDAELESNEVTLRGQAPDLWAVCRDIAHKSSWLRAHIGAVLVVLENPPLSTHSPEVDSRGARKALANREFEEDELCSKLRTAICLAASAWKEPAGAKQLAGHANRDETPQREGETMPASPFADLRQFARAELKGQERAVIDALCDANGEMRIADLAVKDGVGWDNPFQGFRNAQQRLNRKLKPRRWRLARQNSAAQLKPSRS
jgi:hypothetical protein